MGRTRDLLGLPVYLFRYNPSKGREVVLRQALDRLRETGASAARTSPSRLFVILLDTRSGG